MIRNLIARMDEWLKAKVCKWLGLVEGPTEAEFNAPLDELKAEINDLRLQFLNLQVLLLQSDAGKQITIKIDDYESSQLKALDEFKEN